MGILDIFRRKSRDTPKWAATSAWLIWDPPINLIREGFHQTAIHRLLGNKAGQDILQPVDVLLTREPDNPHDENAIKAYVSGEHVGYVRREVAAVIAPQLDDAGVESFVLPGIIRGGMKGDVPIYGVHVWARDAVAAHPIDLEFSVDSSLLVQWPPYESELAAAGLSR